MRTIVFITSLLAAAFCAAQAPRHSFTFDDAASLHSASALAVSPDGKTVLYAVRFGGHKGPTNTEWNLIPITGGESRHLTIPEKFKPSGFTADGTALYGSTEINGKGQLATLALAPPNTPAAAAATPVPLTALPRGIHSVQISPDGKRYAVVADPRLPDPLAEVHSVIEAETNSLYIIDADGKNGSWWCPALRNIATVAWSHDGSSLAVLSQTPKIGFHFQRSFIDVCGASGTRHVATIENMTGGIGWINDDKDIVFLSTTTSVLTPEHVWTVPAEGGTPTDRTPKLPASALDLSVDAHGNAWVQVARGVKSEIDSFQNNSLSPTYTWPEGTIT
ncbi:MAG TPA: hypothetical protein VJQ54_17500, partial [Candidatus Sulfotelmatobacter sp.]|nr:hypothetical protein [Candidatus Sulfotelmatobacter sp.]